MREIKRKGGRKERKPTSERSSRPRDPFEVNGDSRDLNRPIPLFSSERVEGDLDGCRVGEGERVDQGVDGRDGDLDVLPSSSSSLLYFLVLLLRLGLLLHLQVNLPRRLRIPVKHRRLEESLVDSSGERDRLAFEVSRELCSEESDGGGEGELWFVGDGDLSFGLGIDGFGALRVIDLVEAGIVGAEEEDEATDGDLGGLDFEVEHLVVERDGKREGGLGGSRSSDGCEEAVDLFWG